MKIFAVIATVLYFALSAPLAAASEILSPEITVITVGDSSCKIVWEQVPEAAGYNIYAREQSGKYLKLNDEPLEKEFVRLVSLANGMPYYFAITSVDGKGRESAASMTGMVVPVGQATKLLTFKGGNRAADYRIFTVPYEMRKKSPRKVFGYFPSYDANQWRMFTMDRGGYREFGDIKSIEPGKAYWLLARYDMDLFLSGRTVNSYDPFFVQLAPGWNVIGSPFLYPVRWADVMAKNPDYSQFISPALWQFSDGGFTKADTLNPFEGYYVFNSFAGDVEVVIPPDPSTPQLYDELSLQSAQSPSRQSAGSSTGGSGWLMKITAVDGAYRDADNLFGITSNATDGIDRLDMAEPPAWPQHLSFYFVSSDEPGKRFASDIRKSGTEWKAVLEGGEDYVTVLGWELLRGSPDLELVDSETNTVINMNQRSSYSFVRHDSAPREFIIRVR